MCQKVGGGLNVQLERPTTVAKNSSIILGTLSSQFPTVLSTNQNSSRFTGCDSKQYAQDIFHMSFWDSAY